MAVRPGYWVHMVGIAGVGMSGIARVLCQEGIKVSGSDLQCNGITKSLEDMGVEIHYSHAANNIGEGVDLLVMSSAIPRDNSEIVKAREMNIPVIKRGEMLARMMNSKKGIAVAGAHGKTTTTAMIYTLLADGGVDPTFIVGGEIRGRELNACLGRGDFFVAEADESDASFLGLRPYIAVVTNIENDHLDYYKSFDRIRDAFKQFVSQVQPGGFALLYGGDASTAMIKPQVATRVLVYGESEEYDYCLKDWRACGMGSIFKVFRHGQYLGEIKLAVPGRHNAVNALAAVAVATEAGLDFAGIKSSLLNFQGAKRRFQVLGKINGITVVDDYAHHPTEIRATIEAAQNLNPGRLVVVFQPHRYTRTKLLGQEIGEALKNADVVILTDIYPAGEKPIEGISSDIIYQAAKDCGCNIRYIPDRKEAEQYVAGIIKADDLIITMGAGDIWKMGLKMLERLRK